MGGTPIDTIAGWNGPPGVPPVLNVKPFLGHNFGTAMEAVLEGNYRGRRAAWDHTGTIAKVAQHFVPMQTQRTRWTTVNGDAPMNFTYREACIPAFVGMFERDTVTPWTPSQDDMTATDWIVE